MTYEHIKYMFMTFLIFLFKENELSRTLFEIEMMCFVFSESISNHSFSDLNSNERLSK